MQQSNNVTFSTPAKIHLLGEHAVVYGKPALLASVNLRLQVTISSGNNFPIELSQIKSIIETIIQKEFPKLKIPTYSLSLTSDIPIGSGLGSSAATSAAYITALLSYLKIKWDLALVNKLTYEAEKVFHGNPAGADNSTVVYGGLMWYRKESPEVKILHPLSFTIPQRLAKNFVVLQTGTPKETTKNMVEMVRDSFDKKPALKHDFLTSQEDLTRNLLSAILNSEENSLIKIIRAGEQNLEKIGVCSPRVKKIIREIEKIGGAAKICGGGGATDGTGVLLAYHPKPAMIKSIAKKHQLNFFQAALGVEGLRSDK